MKRIGVMGCGAVADFGHLPAISATPGLALHAVYDPDWDRALEMQAKHRVPHAYCELDEFWRSGAEAITVASPAPTHLDNVLECARRGLPALCEKPLAMNDADAETMIAAMAAAGLPLGVGFCYRFSPVALRIRDLAREGAIGRIGALRLIYIWDLHGVTEPGPDGAPVYSPRRAARMEEGGPMVDCGVHQIDLARWWLGSEVVDWTAAGAWVEGYEAPDHMYLHLRHADGALATIETSYSYTHTALDRLAHFTYQLVGEDGLIRYDRESGLFEVRRRERTERLQWSHEKNFEGMYAEWERVLREGGMGDMPSGEDGLLATRLARTATESVIASRHGPEPTRA